MLCKIQSLYCKYKLLQVEEERFITTNTIMALQTERTDFREVILFLTKQNDDKKKNTKQKQLVQRGKIPSLFFPPTRNIVQKS